MATSTTRCPSLYAWQVYQGDFEQAVTAVIALGGDTDTVAAITGALCGATHGVESIPKKWVGRFQDWPRNKAYVHRLSQSLAAKHEERSTPPVRCSTLGLIPRNLFFLIIVLIHGILRYLPGGLKLVALRRTKQAT